ncbi:MAG: HAMP domain-containing sensor histidine kinase [Bryobacteraceae bacterium]|nr:HAMP domain-containing sensor histidine kinase [Bryobacteraceae bacterium]
MSEFLFPDIRERDPEFRADIERLGRRGLVVIGWVELVMTALSQVLAQSGAIVDLGWDRRSICLITSIVLGVFCLSFAKAAQARRITREVGMAVGTLTIVSLSWAASSKVETTTEALWMTHMDFMSVMFVGVAVLPLRPMQMLLMGTLSTVLSIALVGPFDMRLMVAQVLVVLLSTALAGVGHQRLASSWKNHAELRRLQCRALLTETAASMGRLAGALSHELNNPLGAIKSSASTIAAMSARHGAKLGEHGPMLEELAQTVVRSSDRLEQAVRRMQRFSNLDRAEVQPVDLGQLVRDVVGLAEARHQQVKFEVAVEQAPAITCRPQALSAVLSGLVEKAAESGTVAVRVGARDGEAQVAIENHGGAAPEREWFEPSFEEDGGRIAAANWTYFSARQVVREQGGEIHAEAAAPHGGMRLRLCFPLA